jgi:hypothetical protein
MDDLVLGRIGLLTSLLNHLNWKTRSSKQGPQDVFAKEGDAIMVIV